MNLQKVYINVTWRIILDMNDFFKWIIKRILLAIITIYVVITATYILLYISPGNPVQIYIDSLLARGYSKEYALMKAREVFGNYVNQTAFQAYLSYINGLLHGDLGRSLIYHEPVIKLIALEAPYTVFLVSSSLILSYVIGVLIGLLTAKYSGGKIDSLITILSAAFNSIPNYIVAIILLLFFAIYNNYFPISGSYGIGVHPGFNLPFIINMLDHYTLPILSFSIPMIPGWILSIRSAAFSISQEDYVRYAKLRGVKSRTILLSYIGKTAVIPSFTRLMYSFGLLLGSATFIESIFGLYGIGSLYATALTSKDYPLAIGVLLVIVIISILGNILADIIYGILDPRVRVGEE
ncbi:ABC transporter permease subunit [Acidianus infernus]|uniref:ABC transporter permease subunit n=2 Tax=Acidianus infernus TaxID=12915 RepID=A0A6A9QIC1_ACIIN|nr:ABC transporter permease subunit [Acidianus infernus]